MPIPVVWVIDAYRAGERSQVLALAEALDWPFAVKRLRYRKYEFATNILQRSDLRGIRRATSDELAAPWPDLVISSGLRNEAVCRWIRNQSGGATRIVHVGNPWADPARFDLVITTPQYRIPVRDNVLQNRLTLNAVSRDRLRAEAAVWEPRYRDLPTPYTTVAVGGNSGPFTFGKRAAARLARHVNQLVRHSGGSALVTTSARTSATAAAVLQAGLQVPNHYHRWRADDPANPYFGMLAVASQLVVTGDSIGMISEACATGKPVYLFDLGRGMLAMEDAADGAWYENDWRVGGVLYRLLMRLLWRKLSRDIRLVHRPLVAQQRVAWLGNPAPSPAHTDADMDSAVAAVRNLFADFPRLDRH